MKKRITSLVLILALALATVMTTGCDMFLRKNSGKVDINWYMNLTYSADGGEDKVYTSSKGEVAAVAMEEEYSEDFAIIKGGKVYLNVDTAREMDDRFYYDKNSNKIIFTDATSNNVYDIGGNKSFKADKKVYLNINFVKKLVDFDYKVIKKSGKVPAIVMLTYESGKVRMAKADSDTEVRTKGDYQNLIVQEIEEDAPFKIINSGENWTKIRTDNGIIGYIRSDEVADEKTKKVSYKNDDSFYTHITYKKPVSMAFDGVTNVVATSFFGEKIKHAKNLKVIAPTWFSLKNKSGAIYSLADQTYVSKAHKSDLKVWAVVDDFKSKKNTVYVMNHTRARENFVDNIVGEAKRYDIDGINVDFEYVTYEDARGYLQFLRELSVECRNNDLVLSIDNYAPDGTGNNIYDIPQQYKIADYVVIMNYDEHNANSEEAGSVSSMSFMENGIKSTIDLTKDSKRIINAMPFYTRLWMETSSDEEMEGSGTQLSSTVLTMAGAKKAYKKNATPQYDSSTGQDYVEWNEGTATYKMWLENSKSIDKRLKFMDKYNLGGSAFWKLGQETDNIWNVIAPYFK